MKGRGWLLRYASGICALLALFLVSGCGSAEPPLKVSVSVDSAHRPVFQFLASEDDDAQEVLFTVVITLLGGQQESFSGNAPGNAFHKFEPLSSGEYAYTVHWIPAGTGENLDNSEEKIVQQGAVITGNFVVPPGVPDEALP